MAEHGPAGGLEDIERWAAEARAREAADARMRERWLRTQAEEAARFVAVLGAMVEQRLEAVATTTGGQQVQGRLRTVGQDFVAIDAPAGHTALVALAALAWVRPAARDRRPDLAVGDDAPLDDVGMKAGAMLVDVLSHAVRSRPRVSISVEGATVTGSLRAVGTDVVVLETAAQPPGLAYVRLASVSYVSLLDSG